MTPCPPRVAIYARYSSDLQNPSSIVDQVRRCRDRADREGWLVGRVYSDAAISGTSDVRPDYQSLQDAARHGEFDILLSEAMDRLSRDQEHVAGLFKRLSFLGIKIVTLGEGQISELQVGFSGTISALFLRGVSEKTHRGLEGRVLAGKSAGGLSFGYRIIRNVDQGGMVERGERAIDDAEALVVGLIFKWFAEGMSPIAIAKALNAEGIPGPKQRAWQDTTIRGHGRRGTGILRNELYTGKMLWNRMQFRKDPTTGNRVSRMKPREEWICKDVPHLRIIGSALWDAVQQRLDVIRMKSGADNAARPKFWENRRAKHLLSDKVFCASCGGVLNAIGKDYLACGAARRRATCSNTGAIRRAALDTAVIDALRSNLMAPDDVKAFVDAFTAEWNKIVAERNADQAHDASRLSTIQRKIDRIVQAVMDGFRTSEMKDQLDLLNAQKAELQARAAVPKAPAPSIHPNLAEVYRTKVTRLQEELHLRGASNTAVLESLRDLIDRVEVGLKNESSERVIILTGALAAMVRLGLDQPAFHPRDADLFSCSVKVVAGPGFEPGTFRL